MADRSTAFRLVHVSSAIANKICPSTSTSTSTSFFHATSALSLHSGLCREAGYIGHTVLGRDILCRGGENIPAESPELSRVMIALHKQTHGTDPPHRQGLPRGRRHPGSTE
ncbi:hypothetical protein B0H11DRAFT_1932667 [Mycena galericulata]|nr:hypothetical protein B0H11DRAFT_1932667 [Mycena galericulata]